MADGALHLSLSAKGKFCRPCEDGSSASELTGISSVLAEGEKEGKIIVEAQRLITHQSSITIRVLNQTSMLTSGH
jgi:hypothetical protein